MAGIRTRLRKLKAAAATQASDAVGQLLHQTPSAGRYVRELKPRMGDGALLQRLFVDHCRRNPFGNPRGWAYSLQGRGGIDGVLVWLLSNCGFGNRTMVDIGAEDGINGNSANLVLFHDFKSFMLDLDEKLLHIGRPTYQALRPKHAPSFVQELLTVENLGEICEKHQIPENVDVLSIDIDSTDLFILQCFPRRPRIIVLEFNDLWGPEESFTVPYRPGFTRELTDFLYGGASLAAFHKVLSGIGYKFAGVDVSGFDAFFVIDTPEFAAVPRADLVVEYQATASWVASHQRSLYHPIRSRAWQAI